ncbi:MAG: DUF72 domain-containing protein [Spirochaetia bacterium]
MELYIGTSGYSYSDWKNTFYPEDLKQSGMLKFYSNQFNFVELNFSYYREPSLHQLEKMSRIVPENFKFTIKAHKSITHETYHFIKNRIKLFKENIHILSESGKLLGVLLQFPYSFHYTKANRIYLAKVCDEFAPFPVFIEFRNRDWHKQTVYNTMLKKELSLVTTDLPEIANLPNWQIIRTTETLYCRFHGRNYESWWKGTNVSRYDYLYEKNALEQRADEIIQKIQSGSVLIVAFNNHYKGKAIRNAITMKSLLEQKFQRHLIK